MILEDCYRKFERPAVPTLCGVCLAEGLLSDERLWLVAGGKEEFDEE